MNATGKTVLITGVSSGIGHAAASYLAAKGFFVIGTVRNPETGAALERQFGERFKSLLLDLPDPSSIESCRQEVEKILGGARLFALVNNAGIAVEGPVELIPPEELERQLQINVIGPFRITQSFLGLLGTDPGRTGPPGKILFIGSLSGLFTFPFTTPYSMSKYALESMADGFRRELSWSGIQVALVQPGPVATAIWDKVQMNVPGLGQSAYARLPALTREFLTTINRIAIPADRVARLTCRILEKRRLRPRYAISRLPFPAFFVRLIPERWADMAFRAYFSRFLFRPADKNQAPH